MPRKAKEETKNTKPKTSTKKVANTSAKKTTKSKTETTTKKVAKSNNKKTEKATKKTSTKKSTTKKENSIVEYYDLPYKYNKTMVKVLAQTPTTLFIYWEISDDDIENYKKEYGENFFETSKPVLIIHNNTLNYSFEVEINDFANSWYISIPDSRCEYSVTLARRFKEYVRHNLDMPHKEDIDLAIPVSSSNDLFMPNDHVLLDEIKPEVKYKNVKTNEESYKSITHILKDNNLVDFYDLYKEIYQVSDVSNFFSLDNPSSGNPTSTFK